jgi:hypothetical protein
VCLNHFSRHLSSARALIYMATNMPPNNTVSILDQRLTPRIAGNFRLERLRPELNRWGFPNQLGSDSCFLLAEEAGMHEPNSFH